MNEIIFSNIFFTFKVCFSTLSFRKQCNQTELSKLQCHVTDFTEQLPRNRWLRLNMTEKLFTGTLNHNKNKNKTEQLVTENETVCDKAVECISRLKQFEEIISVKKVEKTEAKGKYGMDQIVELQKQMNDIVVSQMKQQNEFLEKQEEREKELATSVNLPKLDMLTFSGYKLKWSEFWDAFENAVHNKKKMSNVEKFNYLKS